MKQFWAQYIKDLYHHFSYLNAYIILGCYCILSYAAAIYIGEYFLKETEPMNAYFSLQPLILMLIIPAITMGTWSEEFKSGTSELLLTLPISYVKLVLAKFFASLTFVLFLLCSSVPLLLITNALSVPDYGNICLGYIALLFCCSFFIAIGCLISSLNKNNIISYLLTIVVIFFVIQIKFSDIALGNMTFSLQGLLFQENYNVLLSGIFYWSNLCYFIIGTILSLWLNNVVITYYNPFKSNKKKYFRWFWALLIMIFISSTLGIRYMLYTPIDMTENKKFTLFSKSQEALRKLNKRINITLYESKNNRENTNSAYASYALYVEHFLKLLERSSLGAVKTDFVYVEAFSPLERSLLQKQIPFTEDKFGNKSFLCADFTDNEGHFATINAFNSLKQNMLEADIMRTIHHFGLPKKDVAVIAPETDWKEMSAFKNMLNEFYNVTHLESAVSFISPTYSAVIVINPKMLSSEFLFAMDQYVLSGGNLLIFNEIDLLHKQNNIILQKFLNNFGINPVLNEYVTTKIEQETYYIIPTLPSSSKTWQNIRYVLTNETGKIDIIPGENYKISPILMFENQLIAAVSYGKFISNFASIENSTEATKMSSVAPGRVFFIYDSDILKDYLYINEDSSTQSFYTSVPLADNMIFLLRLMDLATNESIEKDLPYYHYASNFSIGSILLNGIKEEHTSKVDSLKQQLSSYQQNIFQNNHKLASVKKLGDINQNMQKIEETKAELEKINKFIYDKYTSLILAITFLLIFVIPAGIILLVFLVLYLIRKRKSIYLRRLLKNAKAY